MQQKDTSAASKQIIIVFVHLFSSGMCRFRTCRGSEHSTAQPQCSSGRSTNTGNAWSGTLVHVTGLSCWTWTLGGHWGEVFVLWLRSRPDSGVTFWEKRKRNKSRHNSGNDKKWRRFKLTFILPSSNWNMLLVVGFTNTAGNSLVLASTWSRAKWYQITCNF